MATKWCQECDEMVDAFQDHLDNGQLVHLGEYFIGDTTEEFMCDGPFYESAPPELPEGWELMIEEPGSDELFLMNVTARQLQLELEGV